MRLLLMSCVALALSAILLASAFFALGPTLHPMLKNIHSDNSGAPFVINGKEFKPIFGTAQYAQDHIQIERLDNKRALVTTMLWKKAEDYPFIEVSLDCPNPDIVLHLIWRNSLNAQSFMNMPISLSSSGTTTVLLHGNKDWTANITEVAIDVYGELRDCPLQLNKVTLLPYTLRTLLALIYSEWTAFYSWDQSSINSYVGVSGQPILYPAVATAAWLIVALLLSAALHSLLKRSRANASQSLSWPANQPVTLAIIIGTTGWLALDALWLRQSILQAGETHYQFSGKTLHDRKLSDWDKRIYKFAHALKSQALAPPGEHLTLVYEAQDEAAIGRLKYHLLPEYPLIRQKELNEGQSAELRLTDGYLITLASYTNTVTPYEKTVRERMVSSQTLETLSNVGRLTLYRVTDSNAKESTGR